MPTPRSYPLLTLTSVVGANPPGYTSAGGSQSIAFDVIGDSGAPSQQKLIGYEQKVADLMARDAATRRRPSCYHVGDVVYFYGEENYYYGQFYEPFRAYPAPIFAIPGNHDGATYDAADGVARRLPEAFCAKTPGRWLGAGGILRSTMTQPGVYFTLDAPLVSIVGLYSNCGESLGWLDAQQLTFLYNELVRLKAKRKNGLPAVILAIHHLPRWFPEPEGPDEHADRRRLHQGGLLARRGDLRPCPSLPARGAPGRRQEGPRHALHPVGRRRLRHLAGAGRGQDVHAVDRRDQGHAEPQRPRDLTNSGYVRATVTKPVARRVRRSSSSIAASSPRPAVPTTAARSISWPER